MSFIRKGLFLVVAILLAVSMIPLGAGAFVTSSAASGGGERYVPIEVVNAGFEELGASNSLPGWRTFSADPAKGTSVVITDSLSHSGARSALMTDGSSSLPLGLISSPIPVQAGETYRLTAKIHVAKTSVRAYIKFFDNAGKEQLPNATALASTLNQWAPLEVVGTAPAAATKAEIWFYMGASGLSTAYIDDVTFSKRTVEPEPEVPVSFGAPLDLGDAVKIPLSQSTVYGKNAAGENEQYIAVVGSPAVFYAVNAETGERRFKQELPGTDVIWAMAVGTDGNVYISGTTNGILFRYLPDQRRLENLGVNPSDKFVWDLKASADGKLYGATYPNSKVFEFDIATGSFKDLGSMMPGQQYARGLGVTDDYVYVGIGTKAHVVRYDRRTGDRKEIAIPVQGENGTISEIQVYQGKLFVNAGTKLYVIDEATEQHLHTITYQSKISEPSPFQPNLIYYKLADGLYTYDMNTNQTARVEGAPALPGDTAVKNHAWMKLTQGEKAGKTVLVGMAAFTDSFFYDPSDHWYRLIYPEVESQGVAVNAMEAYGDRLYVGGYQRGLSIFDMKTQQFTYTNKGFHQPEGIGSYRDKVIFGTYSGAKMYAYDPSRPVDYNEFGAGNPGLALDIEEEQDRPFTMTEGEGKLFIGTFPSYGKLGGALTIMEQQTATDGTVTNTVYDVYRDIVKDQSIFGLAYHDGKIYGGTSLVGGLGISPTETQAKLFVFDVAKREKIAEFTPMIPGLEGPPQLIGELSFGPDGLLWGAMDGTIFAMNPDTYQIVKSKVVYPTLYNSSKYRPFYLKWGQDGLLYTTLGRKLTVVDPASLATKQLVDGTVNLMALGDDGSVYYALGAKLYRLPVPLKEVAVTLGRSDITRGAASSVEVRGILANGKAARLTEGTVLLESSDPAVARIQDGALIGGNPGTAVIRATVSLHGVTLTASSGTVRVTSTPESIAGQLEEGKGKGAISQPVYMQLKNALEQAVHQKELDDIGKSVKHWDDMLKHLERAESQAGAIDSGTAEAIRTDIEWLIEAYRS
ncbi:carbohydrate binding domain-containing protein [Paenibacillus sp. GD4]|uniref:FIMAH domain-containing protein n=1 Tax=Paenibacillus sp. GD4 TaxID=3068890 RepID=UPI00279668E3|nr:carbohydrate binding domain-containing protein [Paenibacillus sp. GD4]MDQ1910273.1 carbohydrate binding domain-containing protein [Paenibacillus sp. GD4]